MERPRRSETAPLICVLLALRSYTESEDLKGQRSNPQLESHEPQTPDWVHITFAQKPHGKKTQKWCLVARTSNPITQEAEAETG